MPRLRPVPDAPRRAVKIIRVSKERDEMISPELQDTACDDYCTRAGYEVVARLEGIDESGSQKRSPWWATLDAAVAMIERGEADVIIGWKFSRAARNRLRWAVAVDRVETAGGSIESATEHVDTSTSTGRFTRGMLAELAAFEAERIGDTWREVQARRVGRGQPANGHPRFGYRIPGKGEIHQPYPPEAEPLRALYTRYLAGESFYSLACWLNNEHIPTTVGRTGTWTIHSVRRVLDSGFAAGLIISHGRQQPGAHQPIIDEHTWRRYQAARNQRRHNGRRERSQYPLSGLVRCAYPMPDGSTCGRGLSANVVPGRTPRYRCTAAPLGRHPGFTPRMQPVTDAVLAWLADFAADINTAADAALAAAATRRQVDVGILRREAVKIDEALTRLAVQRAAEPDAMPDTVYRAARDQLLQQAADLQAKITEREDAPEQPRKLAADLLGDWDLLDVQMRRGALRRLIARVEVAPDRIDVVPLD